LLYASEEKLLHKHFLCYGPSTTVIDGSEVGSHEESSGYKEF